MDRAHVTHVAAVRRRGQPQACVRCGTVVSDKSSPVTYREGQPLAPEPAMGPGRFAIVAGPLNSRPICPLPRPVERADLRVVSAA